MPPTYSLIDSHCHLDFPEFDEDRHEVLQRASAAGVSSIIIPGVRQSTWTRITDLCKSHASLRACYGLHPCFVNDHQQRHFKALEKIVASGACTAVGECGLDYRQGQADKNKQLACFTAQLDIANNINKPVIIHSVRATEIIIQQLKNYPNLSGMIHSYSGSSEQALQLIDLGFKISIGGPVTYDRASRIRKTISTLPLECLLLETDAPDQPDNKHHSQRNEPAFITHVLSTVAELHQADLNTVAIQTTLNAQHLFGP